MPGIRWLFLHTHNLILIFTNNSLNENYYAFLFCFVLEIAETSHCVRRENQISVSYWVGDEHGCDEQRELAHDCVVWVEEETKKVAW